MTGISQQFCVRWNSHLGSLGAAFPQLLAGQRFVDVTLACDGHQVHCHRLVLAACSSYFESLLNENPCKHPIIILPKDVKLWEIQALVDFMYKGQVNVSQAGLPQLLKCAETLQIRGLCGTDSTLNEVASSKINDRCGGTSTNTNLPTSPNLNFTSTFSTNLLSANCQSDDENHSQQSQHQQQQQQQQIPNINIGHPQELMKSSHGRTINNKSEHLVKPKHNKNTNEITKENFNAMLSTIPKNNANDKRLSEKDSFHAKEGTNNTYSAELNIKCEEIDGDDEGMEDDLDEHSNSKLQTENTNHQDDVVVLQLDNDFLIASESCKQNCTIDCTTNNDCACADDNTVATATNQMNDIANSSDSDSHFSLKQLKSASSKMPNQNVTHLTSSGSSSSSSSARHLTILHSGGGSDIGGEGGKIGGIRIKSHENLFENDSISLIQSNPNIEKCARSESPHSENNSDVEVRVDVAHKEASRIGCGAKKITVRDWVEVNQTQRFFNHLNDTDENVEYETDQYLPTSLKFNRNSMSIYIKSSSNKKSAAGNSKATEPHHRLFESYADRIRRPSRNTSQTLLSDKDRYGDQECENIICSPNFAHFRDVNEDDDVDLEEMNACQDVVINLTEQTKRNLGAMLKGKQQVAFENAPESYLMDDQNNVSQLAPYGIMKYQPRLMNEADESKDEMLLTPMQYRKKSGSRLNPYGSTANVPSKPSSLMKLFHGKLQKHVDARHQLNPLRSAVVLRNPRGNQPRTYNTDSLYAALMDVKSGESIYRASQIHKVPRKTLRNWMKRWDIKSVYPMPYQLKQAAEKKRQINKEKYAMANVMCEYAATMPSPGSAAAAAATTSTSSLLDDGQSQDYGDHSPTAKHFTGESGGGCYGSITEPGRRIRRSESLLRQAADNVSRGQTFQTVSDMFQIPISTIRFFMARKGILPQRKRGRASNASIDIEEINHSPLNQHQPMSYDVETYNK